MITVLQFNVPFLSYLFGIYSMMLLSFINCMRYRSRFKRKPGLLTSPLFYTETSKLKSAVYSQQKNFCLHIIFAECTEKNYLHEKDLIDIFVPPFIHESANRAAYKTLT